MGLLSPRIPMRRMALITHHLKMLHQGGVPIARCFEVIAEQQRDRATKHTLIRVADAIYGGASLDAALRGESKRLPKLFIEFLSCAEASGKFDDTLDEITVYFDEWLANRRAVIAAIAYPAMLVFAVVIAIPVFRMVMLDATEYQVMHFLLRWLLHIVILLTVIRLFAEASVRVSVLSKLITAPIHLIWPVGGIIRRYAHARFFRMLAILMNAGLRPADAIRRAAAVTTDPILQVDLMRVLPLLDRCATVDEALARASLLPSLAKEMAAIGEYAGRGPEMYARIATMLRNEADHRLRTFIYSLEGLLILIIASQSLSV